MRLRRTLFVSASILILCSATAAQADVTISSDATQNMSCSGGVCAPTASDAVLNVGDLETLLAAGNVTVTTTGSGVQASNVNIVTKLGWSANTLTLDSYQSISVTAPVTAGSIGGLSIQTNDGGGGGELRFSRNGHVTFTAVSGSLAINGVSYTLVNTIASLITAIQENPSGSYGLAANYDAAKDGAYSDSPISSSFAGILEGLGNKISNLTIQNKSDNGNIGLFSNLTSSGTIRDLDLAGEKINVTFVKRSISVVGGLVGSNQGTLLNNKVEGVFELPAGYRVRDHRNYNYFYEVAGELSGENDGTIRSSYAKGTISAGRISYVGGLVGENTGSISGSHANSAVTGDYIGGLVGASEQEDGSANSILHSYAAGDINVEDAMAGGALVGIFEGHGTVSDSYATGNLSGFIGYAGGLVGFFTDGVIRNSHASGSLTGVGLGGGLVGVAIGTITNCYATGTVTGDSEGGDAIGGLVGVNDGSIKMSFASGNVNGGAQDVFAGGLVGATGGYNSKAIITESFATGNITNTGSSAFTGGLTGRSAGYNGSSAIRNSYATGIVAGGSGTGSYTGGLVGANEAETYGVKIASSYSIGLITGGAGSFIGGLIGSDTSPSGSIGKSYWDTDTSGVTNLSQGAGSPPNDPGITGLSTAQLQSGLPAGFNPKVWGQSANINSGLPYLLAIPPQ